MLIQRNMQGGFSMIELLVTILIIGILAAMGAPSFSSWIQNSQIQTAAESIANGLRLTRAEAVKQNSPARFNLTSATGMVDWEVCSTAATPCPAANIIQQRPSSEGTLSARIGTYQSGDGNIPTNFAAVIAGGFQMPAHVTFNGLGRVINTAADIATVRIDVTHANNANARRKVITINSPGGQLRMCDPSQPSTSPQGC